MNKKVPMERKMGPTTVLSKEEGKELVIWILNKAKLGFPLSGEDVKDSIQNVLKATDAIKHPEKIPPSSADNTKESTFNNTLGIETSNADQFLSFDLESLGLDPSEFLPDNMSINCEDKNAAIDTDLTLNANMIPALEGTSLESNCESVSRSWTPSKKASTSKLGLDPSEIFPHNVTLICVDKNAAIDTDLSLNSNMIPALEGTSLKSNCESVSRSWKSPIKASTSKPTVENCWKKQLALPEIGKKSLNIRKKNKKVPYCIPKAEWREIQEKKENDKEQ
nr:unnamed protein product [Callosobruchus chinensis]